MLFRSVQCILKELSMFRFRKMLVFWTWNHHVLSMYWLSTGRFVPSVECPRTETKTRARVRARNDDWRSEDDEGEDESDADGATWGYDNESETT